MSDHHLRVHNLPQDVDERELAGSTVVVIDVLRATTTVCAALAAGAIEVVPFVEVEEAFAAANEAGRNEILLGGERGGVLIPGFDLGNSPLEYTADVVGGRRVFITTTNGTRAMQHARLAKQVVIASFLNLSAVAASLKDEPRIDILCAGTDGEETSEDVLLAGAIVHKLMTDSASEWILDEGAKSALLDWESLLLAMHMKGIFLYQALLIALNESLGGQNLDLVGNSTDIPACAFVDFLNIVPRLNVHEWKITAS